MHRKITSIKTRTESPHNTTCTLINNIYNYECRLRKSDGSSYAPDLPSDLADPFWKVLSAYRVRMNMSNTSCPRECVTYVMRSQMTQKQVLTI